MGAEVCNVNHLEIWCSTQFDAYRRLLNVSASSNDLWIATLQQYNDISATLGYNILLRSIFTAALLCYACYDLI